MKQYDYLISYHFSAKGYLTPSTGTMKLSRDKKIKTFADIDEVTKFITSQIEGASNLAIYNFILLGKNKH
jgi:hypothetical protein